MKKSRIKRIYLFVLFTGILFISGKVDAQKIWSLEDCINYAIENNIQIKQSELDIERNKVDLLQSKLNLLPTLNGNTSFSYNWGRVLDQTTYLYFNKETNQGNFGADAGIILFNGMQNINTIKQNQIDFLASQYDADKMRDDISLMLTAAYLQILFDKELLRVAREQVSMTNEQIERTSKMVEAGTLARGSLLEIQAQGAKEELNVINYENLLDLAYLDLLQILDLKADEEFEIEIPDLNIDLQMELLPINEIYEYALLNQPVIKSAELNMESSQKDIALARGGYYPTLRMGTGWGTNYSNQFRKWDTESESFTDVIPFGDQFKDNQTTYLGFSLNIPIFNGYQVSSSVSKAKINSDNAEYNYELTKNTLRKTIEQAYSDAKGAYKSYKATESSLYSFEESFRYTEQKFNVGLANSVEYNISKTQLTAAESELISAKFDYIFKTKILDFYLGKPLTLKN